MEDLPEAIVINADKGWNFSNLLRSHGLDLYDPSVGVQFWDFRSGYIAQSDRAFWGNWPIPVGEGATGVKSAIEDTLNALESDQTRYLSIICVVEAEELAKLHRGQGDHSEMFLQVISVLRHIDNLIARQTRGELGVVDQVRSRLWVTLAVRKGADVPGPLGEWSSDALDKLNALVSSDAQLVEGVQFLSISANEDESATAALTHFRKLRVFVDITRQNRLAVRGQTDQLTDLWIYFRQGARVHQLHLDRWQEGVWSDSDLFRLTLENWYRDQKTRTGKSLDDKLGKLKTALDALKQQTESTPSETEEDAAEVRDRIQDRLRDEHKDFDPERIDLENGVNEKGEKLWPDLGRFMVYRRARVDWLKQLKEKFLEHLEKYHAASRSVQPELLAEMREKHEQERDEISLQLAEMETGEEQGVLAELEKEAEKISLYRETLKRDAGALRKKLAKGLKPTDAKDFAVGQLSNVQVNHLPSFAAFEDAYDTARQALIRLTGVLFCFTAFIFSVAPFLVASFLVEGEEMFELVNGLNYAQAYTLVLIVTVVLIMLVVTCLLSLSARHKFDALRTHANDLVRNVKELPNVVYRYARLTGTNASFRIIEKDLIDRSQDEAERTLKMGFEAFDNHRMPMLADVAGDEDYASLQAIFADRPASAGYLRMFELISRNPLAENRHLLNLAYDDGEGLQEPKPLMSTGVRRQNVRIERLYP